MQENESLKISDIELSEEFLDALSVLEDSDDNVFLTGNAGTGKSTFLEYFKSRTKKNIAIVAPTGVAALNVKGQTIHSFFKFKPRLIAKNSIKPKRDNKIYKKLDILVIDEISMVRADVFDAIEYFLRLNGPTPGRPFGGVQICVIGDLYQLPPIVSRNESDIFYSLYDNPFFFSSDAFSQAEFSIIELKKIYRQSELEFISALNAIRTGNAEHDMVNFINKRHGLAQEDEDTPIILTTTNNIANMTNQQKMSEIKEPEFSYKGKVTGDFTVSGEKLPAPEELTLKVGAQVMFTKNHQNRKWVNGTVGTISSLSEREIVVHVKKGKRSYNFKVEKESWESVTYNYDRENETITEDIKGEYSQYPLMPAWAITIHKSQGKTLESAIIDLGYGAFAPGQLYVALSRCRHFDKIHLKKPITKRDIMCDQSVQAFSHDFVF